MCMRSQSVLGNCSLPACPLSALPIQAYPAGKPHAFQQDNHFMMEFWMLPGAGTDGSGERGLCSYKGVPVAQDPCSGRQLLSASLSSVSAANTGGPCRECIIAHWLIAR